MEINFLSGGGLSGNENYWNHIALKAEKLLLGKEVVKWNLLVHSLCLPVAVDKVQHQDS